MMLYLHIPFCVRKCAYCDFVSYAGQGDKIGRYVEALLAEMDRRPSGETVTSVFFGGGTPSLLPPEALSRLLETGHRRIAFLGSRYTLQKTRDLLLDGRLYYFRNILREKGLYDESLVLDCGMTSPEAYRVLSGALPKWTERPDALFLSSDAMVQGAMRALDEAGVRVPADMSVIAFNDTPLSQNATPPLSAVRVLQHELAVAAVVSMRLCRANQEHPFKTVVPCAYIERGSVAARG